MKKQRDEEDSHHQQDSWQKSWKGKYVRIKREWSWGQKQIGQDKDTAKNKADVSPIMRAFSCGEGEREMLIK